MNTYRKVPVEVEAVQFTEETREAIIEWSDCRHGAIDDDGAEYETLNLFFGSYPSERMAQPGDWIVCDIDGEFYPCRADIFAKTYEPASQGDPRDELLREALSVLRRTVLFDDEESQSEDQTALEDLRAKIQERLGDG